MATLTLSQNLAGDALSEFLSDFLTTSEIAATNAFFNVGPDASLNIQGTGFNDSGESVVGGTATSVTFFGFGQGIATLTGLNYDTSDIDIGVRGSWILTDMMSGNDMVIGAASGDMLEGFRGRDVLKGFEGNDVLNGGFDKDILIGGRGSDTFEIGLGNDVIRDFDTIGGGNLQDHISFAGDFEDLRVVKEGDNTILIITRGPRITLIDIRSIQIDASDFI